MITLGGKVFFQIEITENVRIGVWVGKRKA